MDASPSWRNDFQPIVRKITFTGSTGVGKKLMAQSAGTLKKTVPRVGW